MRTVIIPALIAVVLSLAVAPHARAAEQAPKSIAAHWLDASDPREHGDQLLVCTLQGLVNRDAPRLFLRTHFGINPASDDYWMKYFVKEKHFTLNELPSLNAAIKYYREIGLIKGLVVYDEKLTHASYAAAMAAAKHGGLLPVSNHTLAYQSELLNGSTNWTQDTMDSAARWQTLFAFVKKVPEGVQVSCKPGKPTHTLRRRIDLDLDRMTAVEVVVPQVSGQWGLHVVSGDMDAWIIPPTNRTGTMRADLKPALWRNGRRALVELCVIGDEATATFTVQSLRFLGPDGTTALPASIEKSDCFKDLPIVEDLRGKFSDDHAAAQWSLANQLEGSSKQMAFSADEGWWNFIALDLAIAHNGYVFYEPTNEGGLSKPMPVNDRVMAHLERPGAIFGWNKMEWIWCYRISVAGHRLICATAPNLSFWGQVPLDGPVRFTNPRQLSGPLTEKYYVIFLNSDDDAPKTVTALMKPECDFASPARGTVPIGFGVPPFVEQVAPALLEFYARHATPNDGFYCGASGLGYANPSMMPNTEQFCRLTSEAMRRMNLPMVDVWDYSRVRPGDLHPLFNPPGQASGAVQWYIHTPASAGCPSDNRWLDDGTPVLISRYGNAKELPGLWAITPNNMDRSDTTADLVRRIEAEANRREPPYFLIVYGHISPENIAAAASRLSKDRFAVINIGDATAFSREAGAMTAVPRGSGIGAGQTIAIDLALRNPDGKTGTPGTVTWKLPAGWKADMSQWNHVTIEPRTTIRQTVMLTAPKNWDQRDAVIEFRSDQLPWKRSVRLTRYTQSTTIEDFTASSAAEGWTAVDGGTLRVQPNGTARLTGTRHSSRLVKRVTIDFDQKPLIELQVPRTESKWTIAIARGKDEIQLSTDKAFTGVLSFEMPEKAGSAWTGRQEVELRLYPAWGLGETMDVQWINLHQQLP